MIFTLYYTLMISMSFYTQFSFSALVKFILYFSTYLSFKTLLHSISPLTCTARTLYYKTLMPGGNSIYCTPVSLHTHMKPNRPLINLCVRFKPEGCDCADWYWTARLTNISRSPNSMSFVCLRLMLPWSIKNT